MNLLDLIFPKRCVVCSQVGSYLCHQDREKIKAPPSFCPICLKGAIGGTTHIKCEKKLGLDGLVCLFSYSSPMKEMIHQLKYRLVRDLQTALITEIVKSNRLKQVDFSGFTLTPVPLSGTRKRWRGFNQAEILGEEIAKKFRYRFYPDVLVKIKDTRPQAKLPRAERLKGVRTAFRAGTGELVKNKNFLLFDDVWTTGATMKSAATALKRRGANKVWGLVLATSRN